MPWEPRKGRVAGRPREWENVHWRRFPLNLTKVCPWSLPSTTHLTVLRWLAVGVCIALRDLVYPFSPKLASLELEEGSSIVCILF